MPAFSAFVREPYTQWKQVFFTSSSEPLGLAGFRCDKSSLADDEPLYFFLRAVEIKPAWIFIFKTVTAIVSWGRPEQATRSRPTRDHDRQSMIILVPRIVVWALHMPPSLYIGTCSLTEA
jgi:hypothetical protein